MIDQKIIKILLGALAITGILFVGYKYQRKRVVKQVVEEQTAAVSDELIVEVKNEQMQERLEDYTELKKEIAEENNVPNDFVDNTNNGFSSPEAFQDSIVDMVANSDGPSEQLMLSMQTNSQFFNQLVATTNAPNEKSILTNMFRNDFDISKFDGQGAIELGDGVSIRSSFLGGEIVKQEEYVRNGVDISVA